MFLGIYRITRKYTTFVSDMFWFVPTYMISLGVTYFNVIVPVLHVYKDKQSLFGVMSRLRISTPGILTLALRQIYLLHMYYRFTN